MSIMPRIHEGEKNRVKVTAPLLPVPIFAFPEWNRRIRDWAKS